MQEKKISRRGYREISGALGVFQNTMDILLYPTSTFHYSKEDKLLLEELNSVIIKVQDHFWLKSLNKKEKKILDTPGGVI